MGVVAIIERRKVAEVEAEIIVKVDISLNLKLRPGLANHDWEYMAPVSSCGKGAKAVGRSVSKPGPSITA